MKSANIFLIVISFLIVSCGSKKLSREEALRLLQEGKQYPKTIDYDIFCSDPLHAKEVLDAGLETAGLVTVQHTQKLSEIGSPLIRFTSKATPYFLPTSKNDKTSDIQKVKLADEDLIEITGIKPGIDERSVTAELTTEYKNVTPFSVLKPINFKVHPTRKAYFTLYDEGWRLEEK